MMQIEADRALLWSHPKDIGGKHLKMQFFFDPEGKRRIVAQYEGHIGNQDAIMLTAVFEGFDRLIGTIIRKAKPAPSPDYNPRREHFTEAVGELERACIPIILDLETDELRVISLTYGLTGHLPITPIQATEVLGWSLLKTMTIGEGGLLRLRNSQRSRAAFQPLLESLHERLLTCADEIYDLRMQNAPKWKREKVLKVLWCDLTPIERLCLRGYGDGEIEEMRKALERRAGGLAA